MGTTVVATGEITADGTITLAKNSDREPNEAHTLTYVARTKHDEGSTLECTHVEIPQVAETNQVLLCRPFWMWGCEMGSNEHGVAVCNEAVVTKEPHTTGPALTGMDLARLALERADSARKALDTIVELREAHSWGGDTGFRRKLYHHSSFIIADANEAWVLETAGRHWAAKQVRGVHAVSGCLTIGDAWDLASPGLVEHAVENGWCESPADFHFARCYSTQPPSRIGRRQARSIELLETHKEHITVKALMNILRDHGVRAAGDSRWSPSRSSPADALCRHASPLRTHLGQTTGSLVAHLATDLSAFWVTGTSSPCLGIFRPVYSEAGLPSLGSAPTRLYDPRSLWWDHERLHRTVIRDYTTRLPMLQEERDAQEDQFLSEAAEMYAKYRGASPSDRAEPLARFTKSCFDRAATATDAWAVVTSGAPRRRRQSPLYSLTWKVLDWRAKYAPERRKRQGLL